MKKIVRDFSSPFLAASHQCYSLLTGVLLITFLGACSNLNKQDHFKVAEPQLSKAEALPDIDLSKGLLFQLMLSEIAAQQGNPGVAHISYLQLAKETQDPRIAKRATQMALAARRLDAALEAAQFWLSLSPNNQEATQLSWYLMASLNKIDMLEPLLSSHIKSANKNQGPPIADALQVLSQISNRSEAYSLAQRVFDSALDNTDTQLALAQLAYAAQLNTAAIEHARKALALSPASEKAVLVNAQLLATQDPEAALAKLETFLKKQASARQVRLTLARYYANKKDFAKAQEQFEILAKPQTLANGMVQTDPDALFALGSLAMQTKNWELATKHLKAYLDVIAKDSARDPINALLSLAAIAEEQKQFLQAVEWYEQIDTPTQFLNAQIRAALALSRAGQQEAAWGKLKTLKPFSPEEKTRMLLAQSQLLRDRARYSEAFELLSEPLKQQPNNTDLLYDRAMLAEKLNRFEEAELGFKRIIELKPDSAYAYNALGYTLADRNIRLEEAQTLIEKAVNLSPNDAFILDSLGWLQYRQGRIHEALKTLRKAYELRADPEIAAHLGEVLWINGQREEAQTLWRNAQKIEPNNETLKAVMLRHQVPLGALP
ncbi:MAG: tetratricopeptide repeat protein [Burkholderiaceae bacterium]|nr:tetratricopeptide repeat protein [Burkholderiaceae bacterium]